MCEDSPLALEEEDLELPASAPATAAWFPLADSDEDDAELPDSAGMFPPACAVFITTDTLWLGSILVEATVEQTDTGGFAVPRCLKFLQCASIEANISVAFCRGAAAGSMR